MVWMHEIVYSWTFITIPYSSDIGYTHKFTSSVIVKILIMEHEVVIT